MESFNTNIRLYTRFSLYLQRPKLRHNEQIDSFFYPCRIFCILRDSIKKIIGFIKG